MMPPRARAGTLRFLIADDHGIVRHGLRELIMDAFHPDVVVEADRGRRVIDEVRAQAWDLVVLDIGLPDMDGLEVLKDLKRIRPDQKVLMLSLQPEEQYAVRALKAQAAGYVSKTRAAEDLVAAIQTILDGRTYVSTTLAEHLARNVGRRLDDAQEAALSDRELQVLSLLGRGRSVSQIGDQLSLSVKTVSTYRANLLRKLGLTTTGELIRYAIEHRLTE
jgi:two-component system, NarL family, invasion response regulator UvrY